MLNQVKSKELEIVKNSIKSLLEKPEAARSMTVFLDGYNAVYSYCTSELEDKYEIEGEHIYHLYKNMLQKYLETFPTEYSLTRLGAFLTEYRRSNEKIIKMLSFLSRYFIRITIETSSEKVQPLHQIFCELLRKELLNKQEKKIHSLFVEKSIEYSKFPRCFSDASGKTEKIPEQAKELKGFLREYIKTMEHSKKKTSLKRLYKKISEKLIEHIDIEYTKKEEYIEMYNRISSINQLLPKKDKNKKLFYLAIEQRMDEKRIENFTKTFTEIILSRGIKKKNYERLLCFYSFIENSKRASDSFIKSLFSSIVDIISTVTSCASIFQLFRFITWHLHRMPRLFKRIKETIDLCVIRAFRNLLSTGDPVEIEKELLLMISSRILEENPSLEELSLLIANVSSDRKSFWKKFLLEIKDRLIVEDTLNKEKRLVRMVMKRIERLQRQKKEDMHAEKKTAEYINVVDLFDNFSSFPLEEFEETLLCIRDIQTSEMYFRRENEEVFTECRLLTYTRWSYPKIHIQVPCEIESAWNEINTYCAEKGKRFQLSLCPTVSSVVLEVNNTEVKCNLLQATILILLGKTKFLSSEQITSSLLPEPTEEGMLTISQSISSLLSSSLIKEENSYFFITSEELPREINIFSYSNEEMFLEESSSQLISSLEKIMAFIVHKIKGSSGIEEKQLFSLVKEKFNTTEHLFYVALKELQEKEILSCSEDFLYYIP
ncbi:hypothetical protein NEFER03_0637 [Nematocida sp. LUAm3]|nr:hypothetical protein NEFER03_0637 [Nematocida sp. LUAm3]KAI5176408.1 hypothetical protein NEFER02_2179 [Nematocida sp. LUAm2]KAI5179303.1 hypothetical protein NEFER01_2151 [Nematocida sp. LUAm1]